MAFSVHTFETNPQGNLGFAFHQNTGEGQEFYFLAKFAAETKNAEVIAEEIFGAIIDHFSNAKDLEAYDRFESSLKAGNTAAKSYANDLTTTPEILVAYFDFHHLYLSQSGSSEAYLVRDSHVSQISEVPENSDELFLNILSGQVSIDDVVILSSHRVLRSLTANQLSEFFTRPNFGEASNLFKHELAQKSEDDILVTLLGIGKKEGGLTSAGFLSKVVNQTEQLAQKVKKTDTKAEPVIEPLEEEEEDLNEEIETEHEKAASLTKMPHNILKDFVNKAQSFRPKKNLLIIAGVILFLLLFIIAARSIDLESPEESELREELSIAREALQQADTFLIQGEREMAKEYLLKANTSVQMIFRSKSKLFRSDAQFILADIQQKQLQVENAKQVTPNLVADLGVKNNNLEAVGLLPLRGSLFVHDLKSVSKTVRNIVEKSVPLTESGTILAGNARAAQNTLIFLSDTPRILEYKEGVITPMQTQDENWKSGIDLKTFGARFTYILSPTDNQIWKYERRNANYSAGVAYNQGADLSRAISFTIDGSVYVISDDGSIQKMIRGKRVDYDFQDLPSIGFEGPSLKIFTSPELAQFLYILDPDNERILIFEKGDRFATYKKQILFALPDARDFVIDDSGQKAQILTQDKIYEFNL